MNKSGSLYNLVYLLHLGLIIVGFGSNVVSSFLAARARELDPAQRRVLARAAYQAGKALTTWPIILSGLVGVVLVLLSDKAYTFAQPWISLAFLLYFGIVAVLVFLINPNAKAMDELGARVAEGKVTTAQASGPPREVIELEEREKKAAAFTGVVHLLWLVLMIDMIWKPGLPS